MGEYENRKMSEVQTVTIEAALRQGSRRLRSVGLGSADLEASLLVGMVTGLDRLAILTRTATELTPEQWASLDAFLSRREKHEPFQYLSGQQQFMSLEFEVGPGVLVPRPETEHLVEAVLDRIAEAPRPTGGEGLVADVGTGSGAIAVTLASYINDVRVVATDLSPDALDFARRNAQRHGVFDRLEFRLGDGLEPLADRAGEFDILVSNPPYIPTQEIAGLDPEVRDFEPRLALDGGDDGLAILSLLARQGLSMVKPGGWLAVEVMAGQAQSVERLLSGWQEIEILKDLLGHQRVLVARRPQG